MRLTSGGPTSGKGYVMETDRKELGAALAQLKGAVSTRPGIPALSGVLVEGDGAGARLTATDLETTAVARIGAGGGSGFRALIPYRLLADTVKSAGLERIGLEHVDGHVKVAGASIQLLPAEDFPTITEPGELVGTFDAAELRDVIGAVAPAASKDKARPTLTGVLLQCDDNGDALMVATDSYRLHVGRLSNGAVRAGHYLIPSRTLAYVAKLIGRRPAYSRVAIRCTDGAAGFELGAVKVTVRLIEGEFPNWRQLMPEAGSGTTVHYDAAELSAALKAAAPFCKGTSPVRLNLDGGLATVALSASSPDLGDWSARLGRAQVAGESVVVAFQPAYLGPAITAAGEGATLYVRDGLKPAHVASSSGRIDALVMPVRLPEPPASYAPTPAPHEPTADERAAGEPVEDPAERSRRLRDEPEPTDDPIETHPDAGEPEPVEHAEPVGNGGEAWSELAVIGELDGVKVRLITGPDGLPWVDVRRFVSSRRYNGPTRKGLAVKATSAARLAELLADAAAASETE